MGILGLPSLSVSSCTGSLFVRKPEQGGVLVGKAGLRKSRSLALGRLYFPYAVFAGTVLVLVKGSVCLGLWYSGLKHHSFQGSPPQWLPPGESISFLPQSHSAVSSQKVKQIPHCYSLGLTKLPAVHPIHRVWELQSLS